MRLREQRAASTTERVFMCLTRPAPLIGQYATNVLIDGGFLIMNSSQMV